MRRLARDVAFGLLAMTQDGRVAELEISGARIAALVGRHGRGARARACRRARAPRQPLGRVHRRRAQLSGRSRRVRRLSAWRLGSRRARRAACGDRSQERVVSTPRRSSGCAERRDRNSDWGCPAERAGGGSLERTRPARPAENPLPTPDVSHHRMWPDDSQIGPSTARLSRARACGTFTPRLERPVHARVQRPAWRRPLEVDDRGRGAPAAEGSLPWVCRRAARARTFREPVGHRPPTPRILTHGSDCRWSGSRPLAGCMRPCHCPSGRACCGTPWAAGSPARSGRLGS